MGEGGESGKNIPKHGKTGRIRGKYRKTRKNGENLGKIQQNTEKRGESGKNVEKHEKTG